MAAVLAPELDRGRELCETLAAGRSQPAIRVDSSSTDSTTRSCSTRCRSTSHRVRSTLCSVRTAPGKTTLLRILSGLLVPRAGTVRVLGRNVDNSRAFRGLIGLVPSGDRSLLSPHLGPREPRLLRTTVRRDAARRRCARANVVLEEVGLADAAKVPVGFYSHGMQKRLSVARALLDATRRSCSWTKRRTISTPRGRVACVTSSPTPHHGALLSSGRRSGSTRSEDSPTGSRSSRRAESPSSDPFPS